MSLSTAPAAEQTKQAPAKQDTSAQEDKKPEWKPLFDGKTVKGWKITEFGGEGEVTVEKGSLVMEMGNDLTGITWEGEMPKMNYELSFQANKLDGNDFFAGVTFPIHDTFCSLIVGGWGGTVVGLSSLDGKDASDNDTKQLISFDRNRWYTVVLRVTQADDRVQVWIDGKQVIDAKTKGKKVTVRPEVQLSQPLGICCWQTKASLKDIKLRRLTEK